VSDVVHPDIVEGRRVRCHEVDIGRGVVLSVLEAADANEVLEDAARGEGDPYAAILWPSSIAVAARLADLIDDGPGTRVIDVGAGTGVVALAAARLGAAATALDHDPFARAVILQAAALNGLTVRVADFDATGDDPLPPADVVVLADLLYEPELARAAAARTLEALDAGARVLAGDPARYGRAEYERILSAAGVAVDFDDVVVRVPGEPQPARVGVALLEPF
jgi:predicted nicotinamide N-methyase